MNLLGLDDDEDFAETADEVRLNVNVFDVINRKQNFFLEVVCSSISALFFNTSLLHS
jgi:hypothetical protein